MRRNIRALGTLAFAALALSLAACNAVKGAGKDLQEAGEAGERAIDGK